MPRKTKVPEPSPLPDLECACATLRRTARLVTQLYSHEMGAGIEPSQFALLTALHHHPGVTQIRLGRALGFDKTTLSRNLAVLKRNGWAEVRERGHYLTSAGEELLAATSPAWKRAQTKLRAALPQGQWETLFHTLAQVNQAALVAANVAANDGGHQDKST